MRAMKGRAGFRKASPTPANRRQYVFGTASFASGLT
jgi:hypothetical protein